jgi:methionyl-tRNA formyltransferase
MLRVAFFGMDLRILDELRRCPVHLIGVFLPPAPYKLLPRLPAFLKYLSRHLIRKQFKIVSIYLPLARYLFTRHIQPMPGTDVNKTEFIQAFARMAPDLGVVANFGQILCADLISVPRHGLINCHPSLLPRYRGPTPLGHILLNGEKVSGATWHRVTPAVDSGEILAQKQFTVSDQDTVNDLDRKSSKSAIDMLCPLLERIAKQQITPEPQDEALASYFSKLTKQEKAQLAMLGKLD